MTLDAAIEHLKEIIADIERWTACDACLSEHIELLEYLEELADRREDEKTGMWVEYNKPLGGLFDLYQPYHRCTVCGYESYGTVEYADRYCGNCGARMTNGGGWQKKRKKEVAENDT